MQIRLEDYYYFMIFILYDNQNYHNMVKYE